MGEPFSLMFLHYNLVVLLLLYPFLIVTNTTALYNFYATSEVDEASYLPAYMASQLLRTGVLVFCKMLVQIR